MDNSKRLARLFDQNAGRSALHFFGDAEVSEDGEFMSISTEADKDLWDRVTGPICGHWVKHDVSDSMWVINKATVLSLKKELRLNCERLDLALGSRVMDSVKFLRAKELGFL